MKDRDADSQERLSELRRKAERAAAENSRDISDVTGLSPEKAQQLIHDLSVHQIELEMQNKELRQTQLVLEASRDKYAELYDFAPCGYFKLDTKGVILEANATSANLLGVERDLLIGKPIADFVDQEAGDALKLHFRHVLESQSQQTCDIRFASQGGKQSFVCLESLPLKSEDGSPEGFRTAVIDITRIKEAEESLRESERKFRLVTETIRDVFWIRTPDMSQMVYISPGYEKIWGRTTASLYRSPRSFLNSVHPDDRELVTSILQKNHSNGTEYTCEYRIVRPDNSVSWILERGFPIHDDKGNLAFMCGVSTDITDRKKAEAALRQQKAELEIILNSVPALIFYKDLRNRVVRANRAWLHAFNFTEAEVVGRQLEEFLPRDQAEQFFQDDRKVLASGEATRSIIEEIEIGASPRWFITDKVPYRDDKGDIVGVIGISQDITNRKKVEEALRENEEQYRAVFDNAGIGIDLLDLQGRIVKVNQALLNTLGYAEEELRQLTFLDITHPDDKEISKRNLEALMAGKIDSYRLEKRYVRKDGSIVWADLWTSAIRDANGRHAGTVGVIEDITQRKCAEEALRKSEADYRFLIDNAPIGIVVSDLEGTILEVNRKLLEIVGSPSAEATKAINVLTFPPMIEAGLSAAFQRCLEEGVTLAEELPYTSKWGKRSHIRMLLTPMRDLDGKVYGCLATMEDVTERKRAEQALRESEERLELAAQGADLGLWDFDLKSGRAVVNERALQMVGYKSGELDPSLRLFKELCHPEDAERVLLALNAHTKGEFPVLDEEFRLRTKSGQWKWIQARGKVVEHDKHGNAIRLAGTFLDITQRKKSDLALRRLATAVEQAEEAIAITDLTGTIRYVNPAFEKITGYSRDEALGQNPRILKSGKQDPEFYRDLWNTITQGRVWRGHFVNKRKDGSFYHEDVTISPVRDPGGKIRNFVAVKRDVTEHLQLSRQLLQAQKMEAVGTLAGGIAHDFNNLLTIVMGFTELLLAEKDQKDPEYADLQKIFHAAKSGADLVKRLLMFSKESESKLAPMNLNKQILQIEKLLRRTIPKMIDIRLDLPSDVPDVNADPSQIEQILLNLALNARDAMPDGGKLTVRTEPVMLDEEYCRLDVDANPGEYVLLEVSDTGQGMEQETLERVFEPFFTTKEVGRGTGLGLAMVYGMVKQHDGHVVVASEVGKGTTFKIYLPAMSAEVEPGVQDSGIMPAFGTETILLVDDEEFVRELGARILTKHGYTVLQAVNGAEALELFKRERDQVSLVVLDLMMPEMGGMECLKELLKIDPQVNILFASGYSADASQREIVEMGAKGFVTKPFHVKELLRGVRRALDEG